MSQFEKAFIARTAKKLFALIDEADGSKPYAAILYARPRHKSLERNGRVVASAYNTEVTSGNSNAHAEMNVLNMAAKVLNDAAQLPVPKREEFYLFVSTRSCPKCTAAIVDAQANEPTCR